MPSFVWLSRKQPSVAQWCKFISEASRWQHAILGGHRKEIYPGSLWPCQGSNTHTHETLKEKRKNSSYFCHRHLPISPHTKHQTNRVHCNVVFSTAREITAQPSSGKLTFWMCTHRARRRKRMADLISGEEGFPSIGKECKRRKSNLFQ